MNNKLLLDESLDRFKNTKYYNLIKQFYLDLSYYLKEEYLQSFYNNIQTLKIEKLSPSSKNIGEYSMIDNTIYLPSGKINSSTLFHELLHMSSTRKNNNIFYGGLCCLIGKEYKGFALDEGYTELTNSRLFGKKDNVYQNEIKIVKLVEALVGKEKVKDYYYNADLKGLINDLIVYNNTSLTKDFINQVDLISKRKNPIVRKLKEDRMTETVIFIVNYLVRSYLYKIYINYREGNVNQREAITFFDNFVNDAFDMLNSNLTFKKHVLEKTLYDNYDYGKKLLKK